MARDFNGISSYLRGDSTLLSNEPISLIALARSDSIQANQVVVGLGNNGTNGIYVLQYSGGVAGDPVQATKNNDAGAGNVAASTTANFSENWQHSAAVFRGEASRDAYVAGGNKGSNTTSRTDPTPDFISIGAGRVSTPFNFLNGSVAEAYVLDSAPSDSVIALLAKGIHPIDVCIPLSNIRAWYPLIVDDNNRMGGGYPNLSAVGGPQLVSHPPIPIYPRIGALICL